MWDGIPWPREIHARVTITDSREAPALDLAAFREAVAAGFDGSITWEAHGLTCELTARAWSLTYRGAGRAVALRFHSHAGICLRNLTGCAADDMRRRA